MKVSFLFLISFSFAMKLQACPLGQKEDHLTIQRVMLNFGKYVSDADALVMKSFRPQEVVQDLEFQNAIERLGLAISCAEAVVQNPTGDLIPGHIQLMRDEKARQERLDDFIYFMGDFKDGLVEYRDLLSQVQAQRPEQRDYKSLSEKMNDLNRRVSRAHVKLFN